MNQREHPEVMRLSIQAELDAGKSSQERNKLGQFATPTILAREILRHGLSLLPKGQAVRFLDPAFGTGSFFSALLQTLGERVIGTSQGYEIDPHYGLPAKKFWAQYDVKIELADFTKLSPPPDGFNLVICNPPYVRHHHLERDEKKRLQEASRRSAKMNLSGYAGLYCHFMALSHQWMSVDGVAGWLIPSEFMDVNYGAEVKRYLLEEVTLLRVHRFDPKDAQFDDALVSSAVVWFRKGVPPVNHVVEFSYGGTHSAPSISRNISIETLASEAKWTRFPKQEARVSSTAPILSDLFKIRRGIATGNNDFFILTKQKIEELKLPMECFRPILPSPRYLDSDEIDSDEHGTPILPQPLFLLDCRLDEEEVKSRHPTLWSYLESGKAEVSSGYLCKSRPIWYQQESRDPTPFVCTYMGRGDANSERPFRFLLNNSKAIAANSFLMLYPTPSVARRIADRPELTRSIWKALNEIPVEALKGEGRVYGGGLHKLEPKEMANLPASHINQLLSQDQ